MYKQTANALSFKPKKNELNEQTESRIETANIHSVTIFRSQSIGVISFAVSQTLFKWQVRKQQNTSNSNTIIKSMYNEKIRIIFIDHFGDFRC